MSKNLQNRSQRISQTLSTRWPLFVYVLFGVLIRVWNFQHSLYFIYDQGRDALVLQKMAHGHPVLIGPISGLPGFFLGPLWYYLGLPGFLLSGGNPYGICLWYIAISCLALPLFWYLAHRLFRDRFLAVMSAVLLAIVPGSIQASIFIWNPLMSVPLMGVALISLWKARPVESGETKDAMGATQLWEPSRGWLALGFLCLALTLQSEFAYGVFFLPVFFVLIPWIRKKFDVMDFVTVAVASGVTFLPQLLFEIRNKFIMTTSLLHSFGDSSQSVSFSQLWAQRPGQLFDTSLTLIFGNLSGNFLLVAKVILLASVILAIWGAVKLFLDAKNTQTKNPADSANLFLWKLTLLFALIPYPFFMLWRGNHGYFFPYYVTAHFVFLIPVIMFGLKQLWDVTHGYGKYLTKIVVLLAIACICLSSYVSWMNIVFHPENNAGLFKEIQAVSQIYAWQKADKITQATVRTYTANVYTEQYDYLLGWYARTHGIQAPLTVQTGNEKVWYIMIESESHAQKIFFDPWYAAATKGGVRTRQTQVGVLTLETWVRK